MQFVRRGAARAQIVRRGRAAPAKIARGTFRERLRAMTIMTAAMTGREAQVMPIDPAPRGWRLAVVEELLGDLETVTIAGRHFTMDRVVGLLRLEVVAVEDGLSDLQRRAIGRALEDLGREERRQLPDADRFLSRARMITDTLAVI
jgi:hypothetical protein